MVFRRTDGGTARPAGPERSAPGILVPVGGTATLDEFPDPLRRPPSSSRRFDQLLPFNGGIDRETGLDEIDTAFDLTFFGSTVSGHRVQSETASGILIFRFDAFSAAGSAR